jgi:hypothetical protein
MAAMTAWLSQDQSDESAAVRIGAVRVSAADALFGCSPGRASPLSL